MSYRNDHDAAIARINALTEQLDRTEAERDRLHAAVEQLHNGDRDLKRLAERERELDETVAERERLRGELARVRGSSLARRVLAICLLVAVGFVVALGGKPRHAREPDAPPPSERRESVPITAPAPAPTPAPPRRPAAEDEPRTLNERVADCAERTHRESARARLLTDLRPVRSGCDAQLRSLVAARRVSGEATALVERWIVLEDRLSPTLAAYNAYILRDPAGKSYVAPAELRREFYTALAARDAVLPAVVTALRPAE